MECNNTIYGIDMDATGKRICRMIKDSGLSDRQLGEIMGLSVQAINKWRHGRSLPDIENLFILSRIFGVRVDDFLVPVNCKEYEVELSASYFFAYPKEMDISFSHKLLYGLLVL